MNARQTTANRHWRLVAPHDFVELREAVRDHRVQGSALVQAATNTIPSQERINWGHAEQMQDALKYTVYAAFAMGVVSEDEARDLGFPV